MKPKPANLFDPDSRAFPLLIFILSFLLYFQTLWFDFVWDDIFLILDSDALRKGSNLGKFFTTPFLYLSSGSLHPYHRPMVPLLILVTSIFSGVNPLGYHLVNIVLQALVCVLFTFFLKTLDLPRRVIGFSVILFLVHPIHVEVVAWSICAAILAAAAFFLLMLLQSHKLSCEPDSKRTLAVLFLLLALSLLSYDLAYAIPLYMILHDQIRRLQTRPFKPASVWVTEYAGYFILCVLSLALRFWSLKNIGALNYWERVDPSGVNVIYTGDWIERLAGPFNVLTRYLGHFIFPLHLSPEYYFPATQFDTAALAAFFLFVLIHFFLLCYSKHRAALHAAAAMMAIFLLPALHLVPQAGIFADRTVYFSSLGFTLWLGIALDALFKLPGAEAGKGVRVGVFLIFLAVVSGYAVKTIQYSRIFKNNVAFWVETSFLSPDKPRVQNTLGAVLLQLGHPREALERFEEALRLMPDFPLAQKNAGRAREILNLKPPPE